MIGADLKNTPGAGRGRATRRADVPATRPTRIQAESERLRRQGVEVQVVVIHQGTAIGANAIDGTPAVPWDGPIIDIVNQLQDTDDRRVIAGHTHRIANMMVGHILVTEGINAGRQLLGRSADGQGR